MQNFSVSYFDSAFPNFLTGVFHRDAGIGLGTFPTPWFAWPLSAGIIAVLSPLLDYPSKTCPVPVCIHLHPSAFLCVCHGFVEWVVGIFDGTAACFDLLYFLFCTGRRSSMNLMVSVGAQLKANCRRFRLRPVQATWTSSRPVVQFWQKRKEKTDNNNKKAEREKKKEEEKKLQVSNVHTLVLTE